jgi:hypothetical protein
MFYECSSKTLPKWWPVMVFFAPITTPYFIFKSRKESGIILFMIFLTTFSAVAGAEIFLYANFMEKNKYSQMAPVTRQMIQLSEELKISTLKLDHDLVKLEAISKVESRIHEIKKTIEFIDGLRITLVENQDAIARLVKYTSDFKQFFAGQDMAWVIHLQKFYNNRAVVQHNKSLGKYLDNFESLLKYTYVNFYYITEHKSPEHLKNYDEYYIRYRRAVDSHNRFNVKRLDFQNAFLKKYPDLKPFLPGERQTDTFRLWE